MSRWRVSQHYGFGAGRVPIQPEPHRASQATLAEGFADFQAEFLSGGPAAIARRVVGQTPAIALGLLLMVAFVVTLVSDHSDVSPIEVVLFETPLPMELAPEPEPIPIAKPEPPPPAPPEITPEPPKPVEVLAQRPPVAPPTPTPPPPRATPVPKAKPKPPVVPQIARLENPAPPPVPRMDRPERRARPDLAPKPKIALDSVARVDPKPVNQPRAQRVKQVAPLASRSPVPRLNAPAAPTSSLPKEAAPSRSFRLAAASVPTSTARRPQAMPGLAPARVQDAAPAAPTRARPQPAARATPRRAPSVAPAMAAAPKAATSRSTNPVPTQRAARRAAPTRSASVSPRLAAAPSRVAQQIASSQPTTAQRIARTVRADSDPRGSSNTRSGVDGVPLGSLAACLSDREEDRLKQQVVSAVTTQKECVSPAGTYRFIETKNLNSFLMSIDRSSSRSVGDRCDELRLAVACLKGL